MSISYSARGRVYTVVEEKVSTRLFAFSDAVCERLKNELEGVGQQIAEASRAAFGGHSKSGRLAGSVKVKTKIYGKRTSVWSAIIAGGSVGGQVRNKRGLGRKAGYAHLFEKGFSGQETVRPHQRMRGLVFDVKSYRRQVSYPAHGYMERALDQRRAAVRQAVLRAVDGGAADTGLAA